MKHRVIWIAIATVVMVSGCRDKDKANAPREDRKPSSSAPAATRSRRGAPPTGTHGAPHEPDSELLQTMR